MEYLVTTLVCIYSWW